MTSLAQDFDKIALRICSSLKLGGVEKVAFQTANRLERLPAELQRQAVERARKQVEQMELLNPEAAEFEKLSVLCGYHSLKPVSDDVYSNITNDTAWEIVDFGLNQVYRSNQVFKLGHYSIEDYETNSPWELFSRPQSVLAKLMKLTEAIKESDKIIPLDSIAPYVIEESLSAERAQFEIRHELACPLQDKQTGENRAFISVFKVRALEPGTRVLLM